MANTTFEKTI